MTIKLVNRGDVGEFILEGRLDSSTSPDVEAIFQSKAECFDKIVLDMEKLSYVSSAGLRVLKNLHMTMKKKDGELVLKNVNEMVTEVFEMTGFIGLLTIE